MTVPQAVIDQLCDDNRQLLEVLDRAGEVTLKIAADINFRKVLVMAAASYFEVAVRDVVTSFVSKGSRNNEWIVTFAQKKGLERQYHTLFQWDGKNANSFFGLFGQNCREGHLKDVKAHDSLDECIRAFLELGQLRNQLAHENFGTFALPKTTDELVELYRKADSFVEYLRSFFDTQLEMTRSGEHR